MYSKFFPFKDGPDSKQQEVKRLTVFEFEGVQNCEPRPWTFVLWLQDQFQNSYTPITLLKNSVTFCEQLSTASCH